MEKLVIAPGERIRFPEDRITEEMENVLEELKVRLSEQDMILSIFQTISGISSDVYRTVKEDYRKAYVACTETKQKISEYVMDNFEPTEGTLSWSYTSIDNALVVYIG